MPSPPSTRPSDAGGRRSSAFVRERHAPIDARGRPALSRSADCVISDPRRQPWETIHGPVIRCRAGSGLIDHVRGSWIISAAQHAKPYAAQEDRMAKSKLLAVHWKILPRAAITEDDACTLRANSNALGS